MSRTLLFTLLGVCTGCTELIDPQQCNGFCGDAGMDAGMRDAGSSDGGVDAGRDAGPRRDAGRDAGRFDAGRFDAGPFDAGPFDAGTDAGDVSDAGMDAGTDAGGNTARDAGVDAGCPSTSTSSLPLIDQVAAGRAHTCALATNGAVYCWGANGLEQLGAGACTDPGFVEARATGGREICAGADFTCLRTTSGVVCWGSNARGQLGDRADADPRPRAVPLPTSVTTVSAIGCGAMHACAITNAGLVCWGDNSRGQVDPNDTTGDPLAPRFVSTSSLGAVEIAPGGLHTCGRFRNGAGETIVGCWGANAVRQSDPTTALDSVAFTTVAIPNTAGIATGAAHSCVLWPDAMGSTIDSVRCWGSDVVGQVGRAPPPDSTSVLALLASGAEHSCVVRNRADLLTCWGGNDSSQLGQSSATVLYVEDLQPFAGTGLEGEGIVSVAAGAAHTCATASGHVACWGRNDDGQVTAFATRSALPPTLLPGP
jgi:hypothetical protein